MKPILVSASFDDLLSQQVRFLEEASHLGEVNVLLWSDKVVRACTGKEPHFPQAERQYFVESIRYVKTVTVMDNLMDRDTLPAGVAGRCWVVSEAEDNEAKRSFCTQQGLCYRVIPDSHLEGFPAMPPAAAQDAAAQVAPRRKKVLVTGCYDWLHSGHVRFFEEVSQLGELYVVVGQDANVRLLKGEGHPLFGQEERRYMVQAIRFVKEALISSGMGWMDAEPEIARVKPDIYAVNEDGDKPEKRAFCEAHGLEYVILKRLPRQGLPKRESTKLRGF